MEVNCQFAQGDYCFCSFGFSTQFILDWFSFSSIVELLWRNYVLAESHTYTRTRHYFWCFVSARYEAEYINYIYIYNNKNSARFHQGLEMTTENGWPITSQGYDLTWTSTLPKLTGEVSFAWNEKIWILIKWLCTPPHGESQFLCLTVGVLQRVLLNVVAFLEIRHWASILSNHSGEFLFSVFSCDCSPNVSRNNKLFILGHWPSYQKNGI